MFEVIQPKSKSNVSRTIRFSEDVFSTLSEIAEKEGISFNALVLQCCQYSIKHYDKFNELVKKDI